MAKKLDLVGQKFGRLLVLKPTTKDELMELGKSTKSRQWWCECECGNIKTYMTGNLKSGKTTSCGCYKTECLEKELTVGERYGSLEVVEKLNKKLRRCVVYSMLCHACGNYCEMTRDSVVRGYQSCGCSKYVDLKGQVFGRLTVLERSMNKYQRNFKWICKCACGNIVEIPGGRLSNGATQSCGCFYKDSRVGENNPNWNPNLTNEERENKRNGLEGNQQTWSRQVLKRDNYTCQCCHKKGGTLNAHHLDGYNWCKERRFDPTNGATLCVDCHKTFHSVYGYKDNTKQQFYEFLKTKEVGKWQNQH